VEDNGFHTGSWKVPPSTRSWKVAHSEVVDLPELFASRKTAAGSTRVMAERARAAGHPISHTQLGAYARGEVDAMPSEATRHAIAAALGVTFNEVTAAAWTSVAPTPPGGMVSQHAQAFLRLTEGRTDEEIRQTLGVVEATLRAMQASRQAAGRG
jgi:transcriptional regulator with XRE-family HTH domain